MLGVSPKPLKGMHFPRAKRGVVTKQISFCTSSPAQSFLSSCKSVSVTEKTVESLSTTQNLVVKPSNFFEKFVYNIS